MEQENRKKSCTFVSRTSEDMGSARFSGANYARRGYGRPYFLREQDAYSQKGAPPSRASSRRAHRGTAARAGLAAFMLICICAFSLLFALEVSRSDMPLHSLAAFRLALGDEAENGGANDDQLGRLKLVRLPGLLTVFAPSGSPILPLNMEQGLVDDNLTAKIYSSAGTEVVSVLDGTVRTVTPAAVEGGLGGSVTVAHDGGIEVTYYGLGSISVERGQPVLQRTVLGTLERDVLYIRITRDGRPIDPLEFLGVGARLG